MTYAAPLADMRFVLEEVAGIDAVGALPGYGAADRDAVEAVLERAARFAAGELAPLNQPGDRIGCILENGVVRTPPGFATPTPVMSKPAGAGSPPILILAGRGCRWRSLHRLPRCGIQRAWRLRCARC